MEASRSGRVYVRLADVPIGTRRRHADRLIRGARSPFERLALKLAAERPSTSTGYWVPPDAAEAVLRGSGR